MSSSKVDPNATGILLSASWLSLSHTMQLQVGLFCRVLLLSRTTGTSSSDKLASVDGLSTSSLVASRVSFSGVGPNAICIPLSADWSLLSLSLSHGGIGPWKEPRSLCGMELHWLWLSDDWPHQLLARAWIWWYTDYSGVLSRQDHPQCMVHTFLHFQVFVHYRSPFF